MNICMRNTEEKQSKTQKQWTSTSWVKHKLGENNREKYSWWKRMFLSFSFKKKQINYISAQLPNSTLNSHLLQGRESVIEREAWGLWCQEHIDACLCNHRNLWMESTGCERQPLSLKKEKSQEILCVLHVLKWRKPVKPNLKARTWACVRTSTEWFQQLRIYSGATPPAAFCLAMCHDVYLSRDSCLILLSMVSNKSTASLYYKCD